MLYCPLTAQIKGYSFEVATAGQRTRVALSDQGKSLDWQARKARLKRQISDLELTQARQCNSAAGRWRAPIRPEGNTACVPYLHISALDNRLDSA